MMDKFPKRYGPDRVPAGVADAIQRLLPPLTAGDGLFLHTLREQYARSRIESVELTGVGFYVDFLVPDDVPLTTPLSWAGGGATLFITTAENGGGCVLFVRDGKLATLEVYTFDDLGWTDQSRVIDIRDVVPPITDGKER
jgi:hypothetical protein